MNPMAMSATATPGMMPMPMMAMPILPQAITPPVNFAYTPYSQSTFVNVQPSSPAMPFAPTDQSSPINHSLFDPSSVNLIPVDFNASDSQGTGGDVPPPPPPPPPSSPPSSSIPPGGSSIPPPPASPAKYLEITATPEGEISLLQDAVKGKPDGVEWMSLVRLGRAGGDPNYAELANRPLVRALGEMISGVLAPRADNFTDEKRTPWGGQRILTELKNELGITSADKVIGESWEISGYPTIPNKFNLQYAGHEVTVNMTVLEKIFGRELYGSGAATEGMPILVKILNSGGWQTYLEELKTILTALDGREEAAGWRKTIGVKDSLLEMLSMNYHDLHRAVARLKSLVTNRALADADRLPQAGRWHSVLNVTALRNLRSKTGSQLESALQMLESMQSSDGAPEAALQTGQARRLHSLHRRMLTKNLSVQVHPSADYDGLSTGEHSKSEAWVILDAEKGAGIYLGLKEGVNREQFHSALRAGEDVTNFLNFVEVKRGDVFFIPPGTMHAIGAGVLLLEPQESSETTYRVYDYGRVDEAGRARKLHVDSAMAVTNWDGKRGVDAVRWLRRTPQIVEPGDSNTAKVEQLMKESVFEVNRLQFAAGTNYVDYSSSIKGFTVLDGKVEVFREGMDMPLGTFHKGQSFIIPAALGAFRIQGLTKASTVIETSAFAPLNVGAVKPTSSISAIIAAQPEEMQARNAAFVTRPAEHVLILNPQGYAGPKVPMSAKDTGGQITYIHYLARMLVQFGYKVTIATRSFKPQKEFESYGDRRGVDFLPDTDDLVRYVFVPGLQVEGAPFYRKEQRHFYSDLPSIARNLSFFIEEEAQLAGVNPWDYFSWIDSHYVDGGIVGQRLVRIWDHMLINKYFRDRFGLLLAGQTDSDPFVDDNVMNNLPYLFGRKVLEAYYTARNWRPAFGESLAIEEVLRWAGEKLGWSGAKIEELVGNLQTTPVGDGRNLAPGDFEAFKVGDSLLKTAGAWHRLPQLMKGINRHVWTPHSLGQLKEDREIADGTNERKPEDFQALNFETRIAAENALLTGSSSEYDQLGIIFKRMPPAHVVAMTSLDISETAYRQGMSGDKASIQRLPGVDPNIYYRRDSVNDQDVRALFEDFVARGVMPQHIASALLENPQDFNVIVEAGRMDKTKRKFMIIEAMRELPPNTILLMTGKKDDEGVYEDLTRRIQEHGLQDRVFLLGIVPDEFMGPLQSLPQGNESDQFRLAIIASASKMEGWGMAVQEGTRGGMPLIASDRTPYAKHLMKIDRAAVVIPAGGTESEEANRYVQAFQTFIDNPADARAMSERAAKIARHYEWEPIMKNATAQITGILAKMLQKASVIEAATQPRNRPRHVVVLAGGSGVRFRPYSSDEKPKQFLPITHPDQSMLQVTAGRFQGMVPPSNIWVATNERYVSMVGEQLPQVPAANIIGEPLKRNTAPAIATLMYLISLKDPHALAMVVPADHFLESADVFLGQTHQAFESAAQSGGLITFGIPPTWPSPDYGYIETGDELPHSPGVHKVTRFVEKPTEEVAQGYLEQGNYLWNSGMFVWGVEEFLRHLAENQEVMHAGLAAAYGSRLPEGDALRRMLRRYFAALHEISIDYALMEPASLQGLVSVLPLETYWSDIGTWVGLQRLIGDGKVTPPQEVLDHLNRQLGSDGQ